MLVLGSDIISDAQPAGAGQENSPVGLSPPPASFTSNIIDQIVKKHNEKVITITTLKLKSYHEDLAYLLYLFQASGEKLASLQPHRASR